jgi:hypothetical protein
MFLKEVMNGTGWKPGEENDRCHGAGSAGEVSIESEMKHASQSKHLMQADQEQLDSVQFCPTDSKEVAPRKPARWKKSCILGRSKSTLSTAAATAEQAKEVPFAPSTSLTEAPEQMQATPVEPPLKPALAEKDNTAEKTPFGKVYVQREGRGVASYHFVSQKEAYISYRKGKPGLP